MSIQKLTQQKAEAWNAMREIRDQVADGSDLTPELEEKFEKANARYEFIEKEIKREENMAEMEAKNILENGVTVVPNSPEDQKSPKQKYSEALVRWAMFKETEEDKSILRNFSYQGVKNAAEQTITTTGGGHIISEEMASQVNVLAQYIGPFDMNGAAMTARYFVTQGGNPFDIPTVDDTSNSGQTLAINTDAGTGSTAVTFGQATMNAHVLNSDIIQVPIQLIQDASIVNFEQFLAELLMTRVLRRFNNLLTKGINAGEPEGFYDKATQGKLAAADDAITPDEVIDLFYSVDRSYRAAPKAAWQMNDTVAATVRKLKVTSSADEYLWQPSFQAGEPDTILGKPVYINNNLEDVAASNRTIFFGDWDQFYVRIVQGMELYRFDELYRAKHQIGWQVSARVDSKLVQPTAIKFLRQLGT